MTYIFGGSCTDAQTQLFCVFPCSKHGHCISYTVNIVDVKKKKKWIIKKKKRVFCCCCCCCFFFVFVFVQQSKLALPTITTYTSNCLSKSSLIAFWSSIFWSDMPIFLSSFPISSLSWPTVLSDSFCWKGNNFLLVFTFIKIMFWLWSYSLKHLIMCLQILELARLLC